MAVMLLGLTIWLVTSFGGGDLWGVKRFLDSFLEGVGDGIYSVPLSLLRVQSCVGIARLVCVAQQVPVALGGANVLARSLRGCL